MGCGDFTEMGGVGAAFLTTHWSIIEQVGSDSPEDQNQALIAELIKRYWKPVYCYLRRRGYPNEQAKDLVQGFFQEVVLGRELIQQADKTKGRFRTFLLFALNRYLTAVQHMETAKKRIPQDKLVCLDAVDQMELAETAADLSPEDSFNQAWVSNLLERVLDHVKADCYEDGKSIHWHIFWDRVVAPIMNETAPPSLEDLCHKFGIADKAKASNMIVTVKRRFQSALKRFLRNSVTSDEEMEEEWAEMAGFLPRLAQDNE